MTWFGIGIPCGVALAWLIDWSGLPTLKADLAHWLRIPIWPRDDLGFGWWPDPPRWIYGRGQDGRWWTSRLGVLNGYLPGFQLVAHMHPTDDQILTAPYLSFRRTP